MKQKKAHGGKAKPGLPTREQVLAYIAENPGKAGKREIARAFSIKGNDKIALKSLLKDLAEDGLVEKHGKRLMRAGDLPSVTVLDITTRDSGGGLLARPVAWDEIADGNPPRIVAIRAIFTNSRTHGVACISRSKMSIGLTSVPAQSIFTFSTICGSGKNGARPSVSAARAKM